MPPTRRLTFVHKDLQTGMLYFKPIMEAMREVNLEPTLVAIGVDFEGTPGVPSVRLRRIRLLPPKNGYDATISLIPPKLISVIEDTRPDIVLVVEYSLATLWGIVAARKSGAKVILFHEHVWPHVGPIRALWRWIITRLPDHFMANTEAAYEELARKVASDKISRVNFQVPPPFDLRVRDEDRLAVPTNGIKFLFTGQMIRRKNVDLILDAAAALHREDRNFSVLLVGDGPEKDRLVARAARLGLLDTFTFLDRLPYERMAAVYDWCDVYIMPTWDDYRSVAVLEAMRMGKPIIDSQEDGNAGDSVRNEWNGLVIDPRSSADLASAMRRFIENPDLIPAMGARSREYIKDLTPQNAARGVRQIVDSILEI